MLEDEGRFLTARKACVQVFQKDMLITIIESSLICFHILETCAGKKKSISYRTAIQTYKESKTFWIAEKQDNHCMHETPSLFSLLGEESIQKVQCKENLMSQEMAPQCVIQRLLSQIQCLHQEDTRQQLLNPEINHQNDVRWQKKWKNDISLNINQVLYISLATNSNNEGLVHLTLLSRFQ